jgi:hypothetical protein
MNIKSFLMLGLLAVGASSFLLTTSAGCDQPAVKCASARGDYVFRYTYVSGPDDCKALVGEKVGMQTYNAVGNEGKPDLDRPSVAIQADGIGSLRDKAEKKNAADPDPNHHPYALGNFNTNVATGDICTASVLTPAEQDIGKIAGNPDAGTKDTPPTKLAYTWSNVQFLVTAQYYGTQASADLTISQDGNQCVYKAQGLYPYVDCFKLDENGDPATDADGNMLPDDSFCAAEANPPAHPTGSGINPDFRVHCDPVLFACVLNSTTFPAIR